MRIARRMILVGVTAASLTVGALTAARPAQAAPAVVAVAKALKYRQPGWGWCVRCDGLFFAGNSSQGVCPVDHGAHHSVFTAEYAVAYQPSPSAGQADWRWCKNCQGLFYGGSTGQGGVCPAGGPHDGSGSGNYILDYEERAGSQAGGQGGWRWCPRCQGLVYAGGATSGACPAGGAHTPSGFHYLVRSGNPFQGAGRSDLLVIAPRAFGAALQPLIEHKNRTGMPATLVSREGLTGYFAGVDDPERIKRGIVHAFQNLGTHYVMLVGDLRQIPARRRFVSKFDNGHWGQYYIPTDLYYAELLTCHDCPSWVPRVFHTWDADGSWDYNEVWSHSAYSNNPDKVEGTPDVAVGRVPAHTAEDVTHYVNKVIRYETGQMSPSLAGMSFFFSQSYPGSLEMCRSIQAGSGIVRAIPSDKIQYFGLNYGPADPVPAGAERGTLVNVIAALERSVWVTYVGHGSDFGFGVSLYDDSLVKAYPFDDRLVRTLTNRDALPIVYSVGGDTGFGSGSNLDFANSWLCAPNEGGAIAYFGEAQPGPPNWGRALETFILGGYGIGDRVLGDRWGSAQRQYQWAFEFSEDVLGAPRVYLGIMMLFGDPSLRYR